MSLWKDLSLFELEVLAHSGRAKSIRELSRQTKLQPAHVSKVIKRVESKLGSTFFKRTPQGIRLTPELLRILPTLESIFDLAEELPEKARPQSRTSKVYGIAAPSYVQQ